MNFYLLLSIYTFIFHLTIEGLIMRGSGRLLVIDQLDRKMLSLRDASVDVPERGWINAVRSALHMSLRQLGARLDVTPQNVKSLEDREMLGTITLKTLREAADALDMRLVYGFVPKRDSLRQAIDAKARDVARDIVMRTSQSMRLEGQENSIERLERAVDARASQIAEKMPRYLWD